MSRQLALPFEHVPRYAGVPFLDGPSNARALALLETPSAWPNQRLAIWGPEGCGKTHLLTRWAERAGATLLDGGQVTLTPPSGAIAIDDADIAPERLLLHLLNAAHEAGFPVVLASRTAPARWAVALPDLASRLRAMLAVDIQAPDDDLLDALLTRLLADRRLRVAAPLQAYLRLRLPRTAGTMRDAAALLDRLSLEAGTPVTRAIVNAVITETTGHDPKNFRDDSEFSLAAASHAAPTLL